MAVVRKMNLEAMAKWLKRRPKIIKKLVGQYPPDRLYRMSDTGQFVTIESYSEDGTVRVLVQPYRLVDVVPFGVFGVNPANLVECDIPAEGTIW